ncbi:MAG: hypothetical protein M5U32_20070 [Myxococcota bacterium]|nr:hypothetical protein [Myxococcota bacterium]
MRRTPAQETVMETRALLKLLLTGFAIAVLLSVVFDFDGWKRGNKEWWSRMSPLRRQLVLAAVAASILQVFL